MMTRFEQVIRQAIAGVQPPEVQKRHAALARQELAEHQAGLPAGARPQVRTVVDGRIGAAEDSVRPYGVIRYEFSHLAEVAKAALAAVLRRAPRKSGDYHKSWYIMADGVRVAPDAIPLSAVEVIVVSDEPYSRRLLVGRRRDGRPFVLTNLPPGFLELAREDVARLFGDRAHVRVQFITLHGGASTRSRMRTGRDNLGGGKRQGGAEIIYPAIVIQRLG